MNALADQDLHRVEHLFEELLEVAGLKHLVGIVGSSLAIAFSVRFGFEKHVLTVDVLENGRVINVPRLQAGSGEVRPGEISADTLRIGQIRSMQFRSLQRCTIKISPLEVDAV